jgi:hypothetical protein
MVNLEQAQKAMSKKGKRMARTLAALSLEEKGLFVGRFRVLSKFAHFPGFCFFTSITRTLFQGGLL